MVVKWAPKQAEFFAGNQAWAVDRRRGNLSFMGLFPLFMHQIPSFAVCAQSTDLTRVRKRKHFNRFTINYQVQPA